MTTVPVRRDDLFLQRFLSVFLFVGVLFFGLATFVAATKLVSGDIRATGMLLGCGLSFATLGWLAMALWAGRGIPRWFMAVFLLLVGFGPFVLACLCKTWEESLTLMAMAVPTAISVYPNLREYWGNTAKPAPGHES